MFHSLTDVFNKFKKEELQNRSRKFNTGYKTTSSSYINQNSEIFDFLTLIKDWDQIVGERLAKVTVPLKINYKTLYILTNHAAFSSTLSFMAEPIKKNISKRFPSLKNTINSLYFQVNSEFFDQKIKHIKPLKEKKKDIKKLHPYDPEFKKIKTQADHEFSNIKDDVCKTALQSLYIHIKTDEYFKNTEKS